MDNEIENTTLSPSSASGDRLQLPLSCDPPGPQNPPQQRVWIVFGATGHIGRSIVKAAIAHNDLVTAVGRSFEDTPQTMQGIASPRPGSASTTTPESERSSYLPLLCDVRVRETVSAVYEKTIEQFGHIDIVANCSGYGVIGACEDQHDFDIRNQFETNFWGTLNILQLSLPYFRKRGGGRYLIFSSTSGALGVPGLGPYCATKYAVEGLVESMLYETNAFNVRATLVEPGHMRRDEPPDLDARGRAQQLPRYGHFRIKPASEPYSGATAPAGHAKRMLQWFGEKQPTSTVKAAELVWRLGHCRFPPLRLLLGSFAVESVRDRLRCVTEEIEDWKHLSFKPEEEEDFGDEEAGKEEDVEDEVGGEATIKMEDGEGEALQDGVGEEMER